MLQAQAANRDCAGRENRRAYDRGKSNRRNHLAREIFAAIAARGILFIAHC